MVVAVAGAGQQANTGPGTCQTVLASAPLALGCHPAPTKPPHLGQQGLALVHQARQVCPPLPRLMPLQPPHTVVLQQRPRALGVCVPLAAGPRKQLADVLPPVVLQQLQCRRVEAEEVGDWVGRWMGAWAAVEAPACLPDPSLPWGWLVPLFGGCAWRARCGTPQPGKLGWEPKHSLWPALDARGRVAAG